MYCYKSHFGMIVSAMLELLMGLFMAVAITIINHHPFTWVTLLPVWAEITFVVKLVLMFLPVNEWGGKFAGMFGLKPDTIAFKAVSNLVPTFIINTFLAAIIPALGIFYNDAIPQDMRFAEWKAVFFGGWLLTFVISYFLGFIAVKIGDIVAIRTIGEPEGAPQE